MINKKILITVVAVGVIPWSIRAEVLNLEETLQAALAYHPAIKSRKSDYEAAMSDTETAKWQQWASLTIQGQNLDKKQSGYDNKRGLTLAVEQPLFTGWKITSAIESAEYKQSGTKSSIDEAKKEVQLKVTESYSNCVKFSQKIIFAKQNLTEHERLFHSIQARLEGGISSEADVSLARARVKQAKSELVQLELAYRNALSTLSLTIGKPIDDVVMFNEQLKYKTLVDALLDAQINSPTLFRLNEDIKVASADRQTKQSLLYPQIALKYEKYTGLMQEMNRDTSRILLTGAFQPGAGLSASTVIESAQKKVLTAHNNLETGKLDLKEKVTGQFNEAMSYLSQVSDAEIYAVETQNVANSYERQYIIGKKSWLDLLNAKREATQSRYTFVDVKVSAAMAIKKLHILVSKEN